MNESREPRTCPECGAVNPWMNDECRLCGRPMTRAEEQEVDCSAAEPTTPAGDEGAKDEAEVASRKEHRVHAWRGPLNIRWIAGGGVILALLAGGGEMWAESKLKADAEAWSLINDALVKSERGQELTDPEKEKVRDALLGNGWMVPLLGFMFLLFPWGIGVLVGYATGSVRDGMISVAGGMSGYIVFIAHFLPLIAVTVPVYGLMGALAAMIGRWLARRSRVS